VKPICNHLIVLDTILKINYFCAENNENYIYSCEKLHKKLLPPEQLFLIQICTKSFVGWGFTQTPLGELIAVFRGLILREKREKEGEIEQMRGREGGEGEREEGKREGRALMTLGHGAPNVLIRPWYW